VRLLLAFIYDVHDRQIVGAPDWIASEKYDFDGVADASGTPNLQQIQIMIQKLFADLLQLKFHHEKQEMSTYPDRREERTEVDREFGRSHRLSQFARHAATGDEGSQSHDGRFRLSLAIRRSRSACS
jgi:hypothetical protein